MKTYAIETKGQAVSGCVGDVIGGLFVVAFSLFVGGYPIMHSEGSLLPVWLFVLFIVGFFTLCGLIIISDGFRRLAAAYRVDISPNGTLEMQSVLARVSFSLREILFIDIVDDAQTKVRIVRSSGSCTLAFCPIVEELIQELMRLNPQITMRDSRPA